MNIKLLLNIIYNLVIIILDLYLKKKYNIDQNFN